MEFKGTKEKWQVRDLETHFLIECDSPNWSICNTITDLEQDRANAFLISKAPEMLEMLKEVLKENHCTPDLDNKIEKLIKEATEL